MSIKISSTRLFHGIITSLLAGAVEGLSVDGAKLVARVADLTFGEPDGECNAGAHQK